MSDQKFRPLLVFLPSMKVGECVSNEHKRRQKHRELYQSSQDEIRNVMTWLLLVIVGPNTF